MNYQNPFFSIIIPVYKVEKYLKECVESVLIQSFHDYEIVLIDDGSPDKSSQICDELIATMGDFQRLKVLHKKNGGLSDARNYGIEYALGRYIIFLDSDDYWDSKNTLMVIYDTLIKTEMPDVIMFQGKKYYEDTNEIISDIPFDVEYINSHNVYDIIKNIITTQSYSMSACTKAVKAAIFRERSIYFEKRLTGEDLDWFFKLITNVKSIKAVDLDCYVYRIRSGSISTTTTTRTVVDQLYIINKWEKLLLDYKIDTAYKKYYYAILAYAYMVSLLAYGNLSIEEQCDLYSRMVVQKRILKYAANRKSRLTYIATCILGIRITAKLLSIYHKAFRKK